MKTTRNTIQKDLVLAAVQGMHNHPTAEEVYTQVAKGHPSISKATVYRNLGQLCEAGQVQRVSHLNAADRFDYQLHPHYHFRCTACDKVFDMDMPYQHGLAGTVQNTGGFDIHEVEITFSGLCNHCKKTACGN